MSGTRRAVTVILDEEIYERFDLYCREKGHKKSTLIAAMIRERLQAESFRPQRSLFDAPSSRGRDE